jgi:DNA-binding transcriptional LysR family regulator
VTGAQLAAGRLVLHERGSATREALHRVVGELRDAGPHLELRSTAAVKEAVAEGAGVAVLSALAVRRELAAGRLARVPVAGLDLDRRLRAVWRRRSAPSAPAEALLRIAGRAALPADGPARVPVRSA